MTAHPRVDPIDGSLLFYSTQMFGETHFDYSVIDRKGNHLVWKAGVDVGKAKMCIQSLRTARADLVGCTTLPSPGHTQSS